MLRHLTLFVLFTFFYLTTTATNLSPNAEISILTCDRGAETYSAFGHTAVRVNDPDKGIDWVYNYGTFDFNTPGFYTKFINGQLNYKLSATNFEYFERTYIQEKRAIHQQVLNLTQQEKQKLFDLLQENYKPENRFYMYDFFLDNCATRVRDIVALAVNNKVEFRATNEAKNQSFRDLLSYYLSDRLWLKFGIDIIMGVPADKVADSLQYMYLPNRLESIFASSVILKNSNEIPLVKSQSVILEQAPIEMKQGFFTPFVFFTMLFLIVVGITIMEHKNKKYIALADRIIFFTIGLAGLFILYLSTLTDHYVMRNNMMLLGWFPTHIIVAFLIGKVQKKSALWRNYFLITAFFAFLLIATIYALPQDLNVAVIPILAIVILRAGKIYVHQRQFVIEK